ncbi:MAG: DNA polymerase III subunit delta [Deltaproteobacteria bacterium]|nr:DNA polymerase III subunit delta [Deltaproteobacteria bacterium]
MKPDDLYRDIKAGKFSPVYYLFGDEDLLKEESFARLKEAVLAGGLADFNCDLFHAGEVEISKVISAASTLPVMAQRRLVVLKDADKLKAADEEQLLAYLEDPSPSTALVMVGRTADKRKKFFLALSKKGCAVEHSRPYEREMPKWIKWLAGKKDLQISERACRYLADIIGNDLTSISSEIEKVSLYSGPGKRIEVEDLEAISVDVKARTVFQLIDALGEKDLKSSLENLKKLLDSGESPILILSMILRQLRLIWIGKDILKRGGKEDEVRKKTKLPPFVVKNYLKQVKVFSEEELKRAYDSIFDLDIKFKSSPVDKEKALELLMFRLCGIGA